MRCQDSPKHPPTPGTAAPLDAETAAAAPSPDLTGEEKTQPTSSDLPPLYDGWELEEQLRHVERVLAMDGGVTDHSGRREERRRATAVRHSARRYAGWHVPEAEKRVKTRRRPAVHGRTPSCGCFSPWGSWPWRSAACCWAGRWWPIGRNCGGSAFRRPWPGRLCSCWGSSSSWIGCGTTAARIGPLGPSG